MPLTRNKARKSADNSDQSRSVSPIVTRSGRVAQLDGHHNDHDGPPTPKRRRVESSPSLEFSRDDEKPSDDLRSAVETVKFPLPRHYESANGQNKGTWPAEHTGIPRSLKMGSRMKIETLPILDNLSTQYLSMLSKRTPQEIRSLLLSPASRGAGNEFATLHSLFQQTKGVYITTSSFLSSRELELLEFLQVETLRKANFATFFSSIFTGEVRLQELDQNFLDIFVPENGRLLKAQASMLLELKTQAFIAATRESSEPATEVLTQFFPGDMATKLLDKRPGAKTLVPSELDFIKRSNSRRDILFTEIKNDLLPFLVSKYKWEDFVRQVSQYLNKSFETMCLDPDRDSHKAGRLVPASRIHGLQQGEMESIFPLQPPSAHHLHNAEQNPVPKALSPPPSAPLSLPTPAPLEPQQEDFVAKAARAAQIALEGHGQDYSYSNTYQTPPPPLPPPPPQQYVPQPYQLSQPTFQHYQPSQSSSPKPNGASNSANPDVPHASQSAPTQVLYEMARQAATAKAPKPTKSNTPSQRRPWTTEEENALMAGLDRVRGPHWSQILAMFGPGGTISESLKDRNQVQLKDKARNLKLFFLKSGIEVPYYLKNVTGDLRTRAPVQASKQEQRERERMQGLEDRAHFDGVQGIMALAGCGGAGALPDQASPPLPELGPEELMEAFDSNEDSKLVLDPSLY